MSRPRFFKVNDNMLSNYLVQEHIEKHNVKLIYDNWLYPERVEMHNSFDLDWFEKIDDGDLTYFKSMEEKFNMVINSNYIYKYMCSYLKDKYGAEMDLISSGFDKGGVTYAMFLNVDEGYAYFYTMNIMKRPSSWMRREIGKFYNYNIYRIPIDSIETYSKQKDYNVTIWQKPSGLTVKINHETLSRR